MKKFEVSIVERHLINYIVEAETEDAAEELARARFMNGDNGDSLGNEWSEIDTLVTEIIKE